VANVDTPPVFTSTDVIAAVLRHKVTIAETTFDASDHRVITVLFVVLLL
jgi:hypothetical protein